MDSFEKLERALKSPDRRYAVYQIIHDAAAIPEKAEYYDGRWFGGVVGNLPYTRDFPDDDGAWKVLGHICDAECISLKTRLRERNPFSSERGWQDRFPGKT
ncbi:MAG: hypothetical protein PUA83_09310 [Clostridiales bacterium]|nr:hypothetical protein [Clostridiales bacterium]